MTVLTGLGFEITQNKTYIMISVFQLEHLDQQVKGQESGKLKIQFISVWFQWFASFNDYRILKKNAKMFTMMRQPHAKPYAM